MNEITCNLHFSVKLTSTRTKDKKSFWGIYYSHLAFDKSQSYTDILTFFNPSVLPVFTSNVLSVLRNCRTTNMWCENHSFICKEGTPRHIMPDGSLCCATAGSFVFFSRGGVIPVVWPSLHDHCDLFCAYCSMRYLML